MNFFITFLLLETTAKLSKRAIKTLRIVIASTIGGAYSLIILVPDISIYISVMLKILCAVILILISFGFKRIKSFVFLLLIFLFSNFLFLGIIAGAQMLFASDKICINNGEIYFDINARQLLITALVAYTFSCIIIRVYNKKLSSGEIYSIIIENKSKRVSLFALTDTGNKLREPFSDSPVIVVKKELLEGMFDEDNLRLIPAASVNSKSYLKAFKPECVKIKTAKGYEKIENVYIALSEDMNSKEFSAILNPEIISV